MGAEQERDGRAGLAGRRRALRGAPHSQCPAARGRQRGTGGLRGARVPGGEVWRDRKCSWNPGERAGACPPGKASRRGMPGDTRGTQRGRVRGSAPPRSPPGPGHCGGTVALSEMSPEAGWAEVAAGAGVPPAPSETWADGSLRALGRRSCSGCSKLGFLTRKCLSGTRNTDSALFPARGSCDHPPPIKGWVFFHFTFSLIVDIQRYISFTCTA